MIADPVTLARREECEADGIYFSRYFFKQRTGAKMIIAPHHRVIQETLDRVISGEITRLIINVSPGYTKTEFATINMIARGLALNSRARFMHLSYSHNLALLNSSTSRAIIKSGAYQAMWPMTLRDDSDSKAMWWTEQGGGVYASSAAGQVTGFRAGHMEQGFQGCFPAGTLVDTENGQLPIDEIVRGRADIRVWSVNHQTGDTELKDLIGWWENPRNHIVEVGLSDGTFFRCTPDHKIYTARGYVRADSLTGSDLLPSYSSHTLELGVSEPERCGDILSGSTQVKDGFVADHAYPQTSPCVLPASEPFSYGSPSLAQFDLPDNSDSYPVSRCKVGGFIIAGEYLNNLVPGQLCARPALKQREGSVRDGVLHILRLCSPCKIFKPVVCGVSVKVPTFLSVLLGPAERLKNKLMDVLTLDSALARKANPEITIPVSLWLKNKPGQCISLTSGGYDKPFKAANPPKAADLVDSLISGCRSPVFVRHVGHADKTYCLSVRGNSNFILSNSKALVHNCLILDDPVKPDDAYSEVVRGGVNERFNETIKSRLALETTPMVVIMQRIHYNDLSGYLLRGGSGEKWHHLCLPVIIDNSKPYPAENTHGIPIDHGLPDGWLWPVKHNESHRTALFSHRRTAEAQYMQSPRRFNAEGALWTEKMIGAARDLVVNQELNRTVIAIDPQATNSDDSDETGIVAASSYGAKAHRQYSVDGDYSGKYSPNGWATKAMKAYEQHEADAIVIETNQGGDMAEDTLKNAGFKGKIIRVHASKGKYARAEPISALYEQGRVSHAGNLYLLENQLMEYIPTSAKKSPDRLDAMVYALTELGGGAYSWAGL